VSVWPGRRNVPSIVAPEPWGARGAECLPRDVLRRSSPATSSRDGTTARRCLCHRTGSGTTEARPPESSVPPVPHGVRGKVSRHAANPGPDFRSSSSFPLNVPKIMNRHRLSLSPNQTRTPFDPRTSAVHAPTFPLDGAIDREVRGPAPGVQAELLPRDSNRSGSPALPAGQARWRPEELQRLIPGEEKSNNKRTYH